MIFAQIRKIRNFIGAVKLEWKHLRWPDKSSIFGSMILVIIFSALCSVIFFCVDFIFSSVIRWVLANA
ncbi:preprotein translocase subunit SecE [Candidatus Cytomitobacter primus]|uniref:Protein translocase subunit SecE n=1 Tax=Candidatus Cytomitobacter primus TaxID=2066024 RepID=A0A5C0UE52_9PROT|nr:preprotein translocase subunit SecE [Candidatus Cytomitobacter primus]QEK38365.1 preprotein translocase subunit SecE [Candidatus Cytomitobacter primus]